MTIEVILYIQPKIMLKKLVERTVSIDESIIELNDGKFIEKISLKKINKIQISLDQNKTIVGLKLFFLGKTTSIDYIDQSTELFERMKPFLSDAAVFTNKKINTAWQSPILILPAMLLTALTILYFKKVGGEFSYDIFNGIFCTFLGIIGLVFRPITKQSGKGFQRIETILGYVLIGSGLSIILFLLL